MIIRNTNNLLRTVTFVTAMVLRGLISGIVIIARQLYCPPCDVRRELNFITRVDSVPLTTGCMETEGLPPLLMGDPLGPSHSILGTITNNSTTEILQVRERGEPANVTDGEVTDTAGGGRARWRDMLIIS